MARATREFKVGDRVRVLKDGADFSTWSYGDEFVIGSVNFDQIAGSGSVYRKEHSAEFVYETKGYVRAENLELVKDKPIVLDMRTEGSIGERLRELANGITVV